MTSFNQSFIQSSVTKNIAINQMKRLVPLDTYSFGSLVAGRVVRTSERYGHLETATNMMHKLSINDIIVGALGNRAALRGHTGHVPNTLHVGDHLSLLNIGGVIGKIDSSSKAVGQPVQLEIMGAVANPFEQPLSLSQSPVPRSHNLRPLPPVVVIAGSCMHAGKTQATCSLIRYVTDHNLRCVALKLTGVGAQKDLNKMKDAGAIATYSFVDAGLPSTCNTPIIATAKGCLNHAAKHNPDVIVVELGDGLLGDYGVLDILSDKQLKSAVSTVIFSAADPVGAWGGIHLLKQHGLSVDVVTGPCTDNSAGCTSIIQHCESLALNACAYPQQFGKTVAELVLGPIHTKVGA